MTADVSLDQAMIVLDAARRKAAEMDLKMDIAVVDAGGNLKAFARMDGAWLGSIDIAVKKAKTARYFDMPTGEHRRAQPARQAPLHDRGQQRRPRHLPRRHPAQGLRRHRHRRGRQSAAASFENDHAVAEAAVDAL